MQSSPFSDFCFLFLSIVLEGAPFILLGTFISGVIDAYLPPGLIDKWLPKNKPLAVMFSALLGFIFPVCECTIVPVIRRLIRKGLPISCAVTYMLAAPIINPITVVSTLNAFSTSAVDPYKVLGVSEDSTDDEIKAAYDRRIRKYQPDENGAFKNERIHKKHREIESAYRRIGTQEARAAYKRMKEAMKRRQGETYSAWFMTSSRLLLAMLITVGVGMILLRVRKDQILNTFVASQPTENNENHSHSQIHDHEEPNRPVLAMRTALRDFIETAMYFTIGVAITAVFRAFVTEDLVMVFNQSETVGIGLMMILAFILSLCSTSDAFIAASFPVPYSARLAFLVYGPMMDVKLIFMYLTVFKKKFVAILAVALFLAIGILSYVWFKI